MRFKIISIACLIIFYGDSLAGPAASVDNINKKIAAEKEELADIDLRIKRGYKNLKNYEDKEESLLERLEMLTMSVKKSQRELNIYKYNLSIYAKKKEKMEKRLEKLDKSVEEKKRFVKKKIFFLYKYGSLPYIKVFLSFSGFSDILIAKRIINNMLKEDKQIFDEYNKERKEREGIKQQIEKTLKKIILFNKKALLKQKELTAELDKKELLIASINKKKGLQLKVIANLKRRSERLKSLIDGLGVQRGDSGPDLAFEVQKGLLIWPVEGKIVSYFGRRKDPKFNTFIFNNGLDISSSLNTDVKAVYKGEVIFIERMEGYGNIIIIDHGKKYYSLYGHTKDILVRVGDKVVQGQKIAETGLNPSKSQNSLYFEIRHKGKPYNPLVWLKKK